LNVSLSVGGSDAEVRAEAGQREHISHTSKLSAMVHDKNPPEMTGWNRGKYQITALGDLI
jgi:hypothetical protein